MQKISMKMNQNQTIHEAFQSYIKKCTIRNLSPQTIKTYTVHYNVFERFIGADTLLSDITKGIGDDFILYLKENNNCNDITVNSYIRSVRGFLYFLMESEYIPTFKINLLKVTKKIKETYTDSELKLLLTKPNLKECDFGEYRIWVFSNYLLATGNRISSVLNIKIKDLDFTNNLITVSMTKNRKAQIIPMSKTLCEILQEYLQFRNGEQDDYVFCTTTGMKASIKSYQDALVRYNHSRGVMKTSAHLYRHTFAKNWILNGGDIFRLQKILGHSDLTIVKEYVNMFSNDLSIDFDRFNPLEQLGINQQKKYIKM